MFVRFRQSARRLQLSLVETRRDGGKVRHEHIASLGAVPVSAQVADRVEFWRRLFERLWRLSNRLDDALQAKILGAVHARVPMPAPVRPTAGRRRRAVRDDIDGLRPQFQRLT
jgi:hypothetical protein